MKIVDTFIKKLFSLRKLMWLFLCGMLFIPGEALAQQADQGDKGPVDSGRPPITAPPMVKYGPPPSFRLPRITCPQTPYVDCMPRVSKEGRAVCSPEYLQWIKEHCPGVKVVY